MSSAACSALSSAYSLSEKASPALATTPWPQYLHLFATERTVSIETTHAHGNASFLSLREQTWVATDNDPAALREETMEAANTSKMRQKHVDQVSRRDQNLINYDISRPAWPDPSGRKAA
jgi:hypothetical protein